MSASAADPYLLSTYDYALPEERIAAYPVSPRDTSRLLVLHRESGEIEHRSFAELPEYARTQDLWVSNNTRVLRARLLGHRLRRESGAWVEGGAVEFVLLERKGEREWEGLMKASAKYLPGLRFRIPSPAGPIEAELLQGVNDSEHGTVVARFDRDPVEAGAGQLPLPHYMRRETESADEERYQTVYGKELGSAAAPTAGLHFTEAVLQRLQSQGAHWAELTLHVGLGTFRPVKTDDIREHRMHAERFWIPESVALQIQATRQSGGRVIAVGTTSVRSLESAWDSEAQRVRSGEGRTQLFLHPPDAKFNVTQGLLTNFHLPKSSLLMLVCAFGGTRAVLRAYEEAIRQKYRFYSYGDAMLIV